MQDKKLLRDALRARRAAMPPEQRAAHDAAIRERVLRLPQWQAAGTVFLYVSVGPEPDTRVLIRDAMAAGKRVVVPRCLPGKRGEMQLCLLRSFEELQPAPFGLLEPGPGCEAVPPEAIDFAIVPCVSCDNACNRLGQGGGYYDRVLAHKAFPAAALVYEALMQKSIPCEPWDMPVDMVVTEQGIYQKGHLV